MLIEDFNNADWLKQKWNLAPYKSVKFFRELKALGITLEEFKKLPKYKFAVANGLIKEDEWVGEK